jgi:hypothetical protein
MPTNTDPIKISKPILMARSQCHLPAPRHPPASSGSKTHALRAFHRTRWSRRYLHAGQRESRHQCSTNPALPHPPHPAPLHASPPPAPTLAQTSLPHTPHYAPPAPPRHTSPTPLVLPRCLRMMRRPPTTITPSFKSQFFDIVQCSSSSLPRSPLHGGPSSMSSTQGRRQRRKTGIRHSSTASCRWLGQDHTSTTYLE